AHEAHDVGRGGIVDTSGFVGRVGALVGWGAPWNNRAWGFVAELGVMRGEVHGDGTRWQFTSPYASSSLVLQIAWKYPVRPVWMVGGLFEPVDPSGKPEIILTGDARPAWQPSS